MTMVADGGRFPVASSNAGVIAFLIVLLLQNPTRGGERGGPLWAFERRQSTGSAPTVARSNERLFAAAQKIEDYIVRCGHIPHFDAEPRHASVVLFASRARRMMLVETRVIARPFSVIAPDFVTYSAKYSQRMLGIRPGWIEDAATMAQCRI